MSSAPEDTHDSLTEREREILACLFEDLSNHEIAERLHLAHRTVKWYNSQIYSKLGVNNRGDAIEQAGALGLLLESSADDSQPTTRNNLPTQTTPFIGRQRELADIAELLANPDLHLLTILAPGGMGKTRLGLAAAERQFRHFTDGVFFVPLAPLSSPDDIVTTIAENVGFSFYGSDPPRQQLLDYFRERQTLLLLDNFEHLLDGAPLVTDLIQAAPVVKVLATSREKLNLSGETAFTLSGLHFPDWETPEDALEYDAAKLFMQSAHLARPDYQLQTNDLDYLARICRLTGGMPLGIVLAAGWVDVLTLEQIAAEIQQGIDILETEQRDVPERQRSVRATFERTWQRLTGGERAVFSRLSVFRGGFTLSAAQAIAGANAQLFRRLAQKALIKSETNERFSIHELLRQYAEEKLAESGAADVVQQTHSSYFMNFMAERDDDIKGRRQQAGLQEIRTDFENIRQAWLWAVEHGQYDAISLALDCLVNFAAMTFSTLDVQTILQQTITALHPAAGDSPHPVWDQAVIRRERVNFLLGDAVDAAMIEGILARMREREAHHEMAYCLSILGDYAPRIADYEAARACFEECLMLWQSVGDAFYTAKAFSGLNGAYRQQNEIERGLEYLRETVRIRRKIGDHSNLCASLSILGWNLSFYSEFAEAEALQDEALAIQAEMGKVPYYAFCVGVKAYLAFWRGDFETAVQLIKDGQDFAGGRDFLGLQPLFQSVLSWLASVGGDYQRGYDLIEPALTGLLPNTTMYVLWSLALAQLGLGNHDAAWQALRGSLKSARDYTNGPTHQEICLPVAAVLAARTGDAQHAARLVGLTQAAPRELMGWLAKWQLFQAVCEQLEAQLGTDTYAALLTDGANLDLDTVVDELLAGFTDIKAERATN